MIRKQISRNIKPEMENILIYNHQQEITALGQVMPTKHQKAIPSHYLVDSPIPGKFGIPHDGKCNSDKAALEQKVCPQKSPDCPNQS